MQSLATGTCLIVGVRTYRIDGASEDTVCPTTDAYS